MSKRFETSSNTAGVGCSWTGAIAIGLGVTLATDIALADDWQESPPPMLQWFECPWSAMERKMPDFFMAGYGSAWVPPISRCYVWPGSSNQNSTSAGYDPFDRFDLGKPGATTAYGTEQGFDAVVAEFHRAGAQIYVDAVLNHDGSRQTGAAFMSDGGYPGLWMNPPSPLRDKTATDNWGDFHNGISGGYYQSENPGGARYCLYKGDLVSLIDISHESNYLFIRQPVAAGDSRNIPGGAYFNRPKAENSRFYPDVSLGTSVVSNPGMSFASGINSGVFTAPCDIPARNEPPSQFTIGRFNISHPELGDAAPENATGYLLRWTQWMLDVKKVDGFRVDAMKHIPGWFYDVFFDSVTHNRRITADGREVNPYVFGECVDGNDFCFDRYVRKPNGRGSGRLPAGDAFANRDLLDVSGAGDLRNLISGGGLGSWNGILAGHLDNTDDGFNNGSIGVLHVFSHDNGDAGDGGSAPPTPSNRQQGWYAHAYMLLRTGQTEVYHNARGVSRSGSGFYPRQGLPNALGQDSASTNTDATITTLVQLANEVGRGEFYPRVVDNDVIVYERATRTGSTLRGNCLVGCNDRYDGGFDQRTTTTAFPAGMRLIELTGNAANATVDPNNDIAEVLTVGAGGQVTIRVPRNVSATGTEHNRGYVVYAPAIPAGTLELSGATSTLSADPATTSAYRRRLTALPVVTTDSFEIQLTTTNGDPGATDNSHADDNAVFRLNEGYDDWNSNGAVDIDYTNAVVGGYEQFTTRHEPLADSANTEGHYAQVIDATRLEEGVNYLSVVAFRKGDASEGPLFREFRRAFYVDRVPPVVQAEISCPLPAGTTSARFIVRTLDRTATSVHVIRDPAPTSTPLALANALNACPRLDRNEFQAAISGLTDGEHTLLILAFEETGRGSHQYITCRVGEAPRCPADYNGDGGVDGGDVEAFFTDWEAGQPTADVNSDGGVDGGDIETFFVAWERGGC